MKVGVDVGRSGIKAFNGDMRLFSLPTMVRVPENGELSRESSLERLVKQDGLLYVESWRLGYHGEDWCVGERAERMGLLSQHVMTVAKADAATRLLVLAALTAMDCPMVVEACVGLPLHGYDEQGRVLQDLLRGEHHVVVRGRERMLILKGTVVPEGLGLWLRSLSPDGVQVDPVMMNVPTAVLDFGHRTVQMGVFAGLRMYPNVYVSAHGMYELWERALIEQFEGSGQTVFESPQRAVFTAQLLRFGELSLRGKTVTLEMLKPRLKLHAGRLWVRLAEEIRRALEQIPYERVVAGGGGVNLFEEEVEEAFGGQVTILRDRFAQAEGYRLFLEHRTLLRERA